MLIPPVELIMAGTAVIKALVASLCLFSGASAWLSVKRQTLTADQIQTQALANAYKVLDGTLSDGLTNRNATCKKNTVSIRKE
jgi:tyrosinase